MTFRFIHAADLHLDTPFKGIAANDSEVARRLRDASLDSFDNLINLAVTRKAAFVLFAGDIYDGAERGVRAQLRFQRGLEKLSENGIRACIVHGNHDPLSGWSAIRDDQWPEGVTIFAHDKPGEALIELEGRIAVRVHGISYAKKEMKENLSLLFRRSDGPGMQIGLLHCNLGKNSDHPDYSPCSTEDLLRAGMDYWALGHIHKRSKEQRGRSWIVYPGNTQGRSPKPAETGAKGVFVVEADSDGVRNIEFEPVDCARFIEMKTDITSAADILDVKRALISEASRVLEKNNGRLLVIRGVLTGVTPVHSKLTEDGITGILSDLRDEDPFEGDVYWESVLDNSRRELDLNSIRRRNDFLSAVLRYSESIFEEGMKDEREELSEQCAPGSQFPDSLELLHDEDAFRKASQLALEMLYEDEA